MASKQTHKQMDKTSRSFAIDLDRRRERAMKKREAWERTGLGLEQYRGGGRS